MRNVVFILSVILILNGCSRHNINSPVMTNLIGNFTYSVNATRYSDSSLSDLTFSSGSLVVTLTSSKYSSGQAVILVSDSSNATIFSDTVKSNKTIVITPHTTAKPRYCTINIRNLTAKLTFVVTGQ